MEGSHAVDCIFRIDQPHHQYQGFLTGLERSYLKRGSLCEKTPDANLMMEVLTTNCGCPGGMAPYVKQSTTKLRNYNNVGNAIIDEDHPSRRLAAFDRMKYVQDPKYWISGIFSNKAFHRSECAAITLMVQLGNWPRDTACGAKASKCMSRAHEEAVLALVSIKWNYNPIFELFVVGVATQLPHIDMSAFLPLTRSEKLRTLYEAIFVFSRWYRRRMMGPCKSHHELLLQRLGVVPRLLGNLRWATSRTIVVASWEHLTNPRHFAGIPVTHRLFMVFAYAIAG